MSKKIIRLTENDLGKLVKKIINEEPTNMEERMGQEEIENRIIRILNFADEFLTKREFDSMAESIIDYIDEISRSKREVEF
jgi:hypothetical protein